MFLIFKQESRKLNLEVDFIKFEEFIVQEKVSEKFSFFFHNTPILLGQDKQASREVTLSGFLLQVNFLEKLFYYSIIHLG